MNKICKCGNRLAHNNISGLCKDCNPVKTGAYVSDSKRRRKKLLVEHKGGECEVCGYNKSEWALTFHHRDPALKEYGLSNKNCRSLEKDLIEVEKCSLLCHNCHAELHERIQEELNENMRNF